MSSKEVPTAGKQCQAASFQEAGATVIRLCTHCQYPHIRHRKTANSHRSEPLVLVSNVHSLRTLSDPSTFN